MNDILSELPPDIREHIECIMDDCIVFTLFITTHKNVLKCFLYKLKEYDMLLTINKKHTFRLKVKYMGLSLSNSDGLPTIAPLGCRIKAISTLPIPITTRGIKSFIGCVIYLAQFMPKLSNMIKPINDILKKRNKLHKLNKIQQPSPTYTKDKGSGERKSPVIQKFWLEELTANFEAIKNLIVQATCPAFTKQQG